MSLISRSTEQQGTSATRETIVLVEDDLGNAEMLTMLLQGEGLYHVLCFRSGVEALANIHNITVHCPALFLLDYTLPTMTALDLYARLHAITELASVPTIILTAKEMHDEEKKQFVEQHLLVVSKPYDISELLATIQQAIGYHVH